MNTFKRFLSLFLITTLAISVWGDNVTFTWGTNPSAYTSGSSSFSQGIVSFVGGNNSGNTNTRAWSDGLRIYNGGTATFSVPSGYVITAISGYASFSYSNATGQQSVEFTGLSKTTCASDVTVTYSGGTGTDPTITFNDGSYTIGSPALDLSTLFSSNSTGAVTYTVKTAGGTGASIDGTNFTATSAGTCTVQAAQAAQGTFNAKTVTADITVSVAPIDVTLYYKGTSATLDDQANPYTLPTTGTYVENACDEWVFDGWYCSTYGTPDASESKPTYITQLEATGSAYAVYKHTETSGTPTSVKDTLVYTDLSATSTSYVAFSSVYDHSDARYAGESAAGNSSIQLRSNNSTSGIVTTTSGGKGKTLTVVWNSNTANGRTINVYGKGTAYSDASDLYGSSSDQGTLIGTIIYGTNTELNLGENYEYIGLRSSSGALYLDKIVIEWTSGATTKYSTTADCRDCKIPTLTFSESSVNGNVGDVITKTAILGGDYSLNEDVVYTSSNPTKASVDPSTGAVTIHDALGATEDPITITATLEPVDNGGTNCQRRATATYTLRCYNTVTWKVAGSEYTTGGPTTQTTKGGTITTFPTDPTPASVGCDGKVFRGWTTSEYEGATAPAILYTSSDEVHISTNTTLHAVFAESGGESTTDFRKITALSELTEGKHVLIVHRSTSRALDSVAKDIGYNAEALTISDGKTTISKASLVWTVGVGENGGRYFYQGDHYINSYVNEGGTNHYLWVDEYSDEWMITGSGSGPFILASSEDAGYYLYYYSSKQIFHTGTSGSGTTYQMDFYIPDVGFQNYATSCCNEVETPTAEVLARDTRATISWENQVGATNGYSLVVKEGETTKYENTYIAAGTTSIEVTGLSESKAHTFILTAKGATCSRSYYGTFTTTDCEDVPSGIVVTPALKSATIRWTMSAASATIRVYSDEKCLTQVGLDYTAQTSPASITGLEENTTYYLKIWANGTCMSEVNSFTTNSPSLELVEWFPDSIRIIIDADDHATLLIEDKQETGTTVTSYADSLFFSKYFEAAANTKLLAIYNGTDHAIDVRNYQIWTADIGTKVTSGYASWEKKKRLGDILTTSDLYIMQPGDERIFITYNTGNTSDEAIIKCAKDNPESGYDKYIRVNWLNFNGNDAIGLINPEGNLIDLIGAGDKDNTYLGASDSEGVIKYTNAAAEDFMDAPGGWLTKKGVDASTNAENYALSTNRCLLIRLNTVKSGLTAVAENTTDFKTLGDYINSSSIAAKGEWKGIQIPGETGSATAPGVLAACVGFEYVGKYDYNAYYATYDTISKIDEIGGDRNEDGTYTIKLPQLDTLSCSMMKINVYEGVVLKASKEYKVPIMVEESKTTNDTIFKNKWHDLAACEECDVVILKGATLTKTNAGANDASTVRNLTIYPGGTMVVPNTNTFNVNSIQFRVEGERAPMAKLKGDLITSDQQVIVSRRIKNDRYYFFSLPYDCNIADIRWSNGEVPVRGTDYEIVEYDAATRASEGSTKGAPGHWKPVEGAQLKAGVGYNVAVGSDILRELIFPMAIGQTNLTTKENDKTTNKVTLAKHIGTTSINNHNWNLIAHPYVSQFTAYDDAKIKVGYLHCVTPATPEAPNSGVWELLDGGNVYLTMPSFAASKITYTHTISSAPSLKMDPFLAVFVQAASEGELTFEQSNRILNAPARHLAAEAEYEDASIFIGVTLSGNGQSDQTNVRIRPDFTDEYQLGYDLQKFTTYYTERPQIYMKTPAHQLAFQAVNDSVAKNTFLPVGVYCYQPGTFTFALSEDYPIDEVEAVYLYDATTGTTTNLLYDTYSITTTKQLYTNSRFALNVIVNRKAPQITTGMDALDAPDNMVRKILINGHVYIQRGGAIYDITGKEVFNF